MAAEPYIAFSEDCAYAFVERSPDTSEAVTALAWLDARMTDEAKPALTHEAWSPESARVVGLEVWDEYAGRRLEQPAPGARVLWRIEVRDALTVKEPADDDSAVEQLFALLADLHQQGSLDEQELARARLLHDAFQRAEADRRARQVARPADAPRAYLTDDDGALMARMFLQLTTALANGSGQDAQKLAEAMRPLQGKLEEEDERQIQALRAELGERDRS